MSNITVHHSKEEGEGNNEVNTWIGFLIGGNSVLVNDLLERSRKLIQLEKCRWV